MDIVSSRNFHTSSMFTHLRRAFAWLLTVVVFWLFLYSPVTVAGSSSIVFELEPQFVTQDRQPTQDWLNNLEPHRDDIGKAREVQPIRIPAKAERHPVLRNIFRMVLGEDNDIGSAIETLRKLDGVVWCEANPIRHTCGFGQPVTDGVDAPPNDPYFPLQWGLRRINVLPAWDISHGDTSVTIAIVDIGVDIDHGDLINKRWINYPELNGNPGIDDDGNGFVDDVYGWDFRGNDPDPRPEYGDGHGTHVAGIAAASTDNAYGIAGVGGNCRIMPVRAGVGNSVGYGYEGIIYAAASGADIINMSWGSNTPSIVERITTEYAAEQGALLVAASGNRSGSGSFMHYPAAYEKVIGVTSINSGDIISAVANTGDWVDISAPGDSILSTVPSGFAISTGTSMATPMVAGAASLLKAAHPDWTEAQIRRQLILSSDPIDNLNPQLAGNIGRGQLNLYRALTEKIAGFDLVDVLISDLNTGNGDGIVEPGERQEITVTIKNLLSLAGEPEIWLSSESNHIQIEPDRIDLGVIEPEASTNNRNSPFRVRISPNAAYGNRIECSLHLEGENLVTEKYPIIINVMPQYDEHDNGSVSLTLTNFGAIGYYDYIQDESVGEGMRYPKNGLSALYHGSLVAGASQGRVSDCAFGDSAFSRFDFTPFDNGFGVMNLDDGSQLSFTTYSDQSAQVPLGLEVVQYGYSYPDPPDDDYIIISYSVVNRSRSTLDSVQIGLFLDWDIVHAMNNICRWDDESGLGWMQHATGDFPLFGAAIMDDEPGFYSVIDNVQEFNESFWTDQDKLNRMRSGFENTNTPTAGDYSMMLGTSCVDLNENEQVDVTFVTMAGDNLDDLKANLAAARQRWSAMAFDHSRPSQIPSQLRLVSVYPMPFNSAANIIFRTDYSGFAGCIVYNSLGRQINQYGVFYLETGVHKLPVLLRNAPSGKYYVQIHQCGQSLTVPIILVR